MAGPRPDDPYSSVPKVAPNGGMPSDYVSVRANPNQFGAQVGQSIQQVGKTLGGLGDEAINIAVQRQGMLNETMATDAETAASAEYGKIIGKFRATEGLETVNALPKTIQELQQVRHNIGATLPNPAAQRAFNTMASRREAFLLQEANTYSAAQIKAADRNSAKASYDLSIAQASDPSVAFSDVLFGDSVGNIKFQAARILTAQGYGADAGTGMRQDPKTGDFHFDDTDAGRQAKAVADNLVSEAKGKAWENRINTVAFDPKTGSIVNAVEMLDRNRGNIPPDAYAKLSAKLAGPYRANQARVDADTVLGQVSRGYQDLFTEFNHNSAPGMISPGNLDPYNRTLLNNPDGSSSTASTISIGTDKGEVVIPTVIDGKRLSNEDAIAHYKETGENFGIFKTPEEADRFSVKLHNSQADDPKFKIASLFPGLQITSSKRSPEKNAQVGGVPNSMHLSGSAVDVVLPQGVTFETFKKSLQDKGIKTTELINEGDHVHVGWGSKNQGYVSQADYLRTNYADVMERARTEAETRFPGDTTYQDQVVQRTEQRVNDIIRTQELSNRADQNLLLQATNGKFNKNQPLTSIQQIEAGPPEVREAYSRFIMNDAYGPQKLNNLLTANSRGQRATFGTDFWKHYLDMSSGRVTQPDDFLNYVGGDDKSPLTNTGYNVLTKLMDGHNTPEGHTFLEAERKFLTNMHKQYTGGVLNPGVSPTFVTPQFQQALREVLPKIQAGRADGKTPEQLFSPKLNGRDNPDYIMSSIKPPNPMELFKSQVLNNTSQGAEGSYASLGDLQKAVKENKITRDKATELALANKWVQPSKPSVPVPNF